MKSYQVNLFLAGFSHLKPLCDQAPASIISASNLAKDESALKRKSEQDSDGMSSKNQRVDDFEEVPMDSDESGTCDLIVLGLSWKVCYFYTLTCQIIV